MSKPLQQMSSWDASSQALASSVPAESWQATRAQTALATQLLRDHDDDLAGAARDIGRRIDDSHLELFVSCDAGEAMQQQLDVAKPEFIVIHDIGTASSRRLVAGIAAALGRTVQKLAIRRQGLGVELATLEFAELPTADGRTLRLYTTEIDADTHARHELARVLLAFSRLGVVMVGDLPAHALATALKPIAQAIGAGPWPNQHLLMLPLASASTLAAQAASLGPGRVTVRTTPQVKRPADAWNYLAGSWNRLREQLAPAGIALPEIGTLAPAAPGAPNAPATAANPPAALPMRPMPEVPTTKPAERGPEAAGSDPLSRYVTKLLDITGMVSVCVFELGTQRSIAHAGARPGPAMLANQGAAMAGAMLDASRALGLGATPPDASITLGAHHLIVRPVPGKPGLMLHAVLDRSAANLMLARLQIGRMDALLDA